MNKKMFLILLLPVSLVIHGGLDLKSITHALSSSFIVHQNQHNDILSVSKENIRPDFGTLSHMEQIAYSDFSEPDNEHAYENEALYYASLDQTYDVPLAPVRWSISSDKENPVLLYLASLQDKEWCIRSHLVVDYDDFMESTEKDFDKALFAILVKK